MQLQMDALREVLARGTRDWPANRSRAAGYEQIKLMRLTEMDGVEAYLTTFEWLMAMGGIDEDSWAIRLTPQLTGKAQEAYAAMRGEDADSYRKVTEAVLRRYNICVETYRHRFQATQKKERGVHGAGHTTPGPRAEVAVGVRVGGGNHRGDHGGAAGQHAVVRPSNMFI